MSVLDGAVFSGLLLVMRLLFSFFAVQIPPTFVVNPGKGIVIQILV